jgi:hypothetical protein
MVYPFPQASRDIASLAIWSSHKVAASFSSQRVAAALVSERNLECRQWRMSANGRYCCKSLFALLIKNSPGCRRDFRVKMWGTSSPDDKLTGDLSNVIEARQSGGRRLVRVMAGKIITGEFSTFATISALLGPEEMSELSPLSGLKRTFDQLALT